MILRYYLMFLLCAELLSGCHLKTQSEKGASGTYEERLTNVLKMPALKPYLSDGCTTVYILQTNKCLMCTRSSLDSIRRQLTVDRHQVFFLLSGHMAEMDSFLQANFAHDSVAMLYDDNVQMPGLGLIFYRDIMMQICDGKVQQWHFVD